MATSMHLVLMELFLWKRALILDPTSTSPDGSVGHENDSQTRQTSYGMKMMR